MLASVSDPERFTGGRLEMSRFQGYDREAGKKIRWHVRGRIAPVRIGQCKIPGKNASQHLIIKLDELEGVDAGEDPTKAENWKPRTVREEDLTVCMTLKKVDTSTQVMEIRGFWNDPIRLYPAGVETDWGVPG